jgi:hypothetical protein
MRDCLECGAIMMRPSPNPKHWYEKYYLCPLCNHYKIGNEMIHEDIVLTNREEDLCQERQS